MMSCIFDDEDEGEESFSSASSSSAQSPSPLKQQNPLPPSRKMNFKQRFMRKGAAKPKLDQENGKESKKVQRSASAIFKSKVSKVMLTKRKKNEKLEQSKTGKMLSFSDNFIFIIAF